LRSPSVRWVAPIPSAIASISVRQPGRITPDADFVPLTGTYSRRVQAAKRAAGEAVASECTHPTGVTKHQSGSVVSEVKAQQMGIEQQVVDKVYARLAVMREQTRALESEGHSRAASGPLTGLVERDAMVLRAAARMSDLDGQEEGIVFGRLDFDDGDTYRIGRLGVRDEDREPLVVDWRAPAAAPFYRATTGEPLGVERRRIIICEGPKVVGLDDDVLSTTDVEGVVGEGALLKSLTRERGEHMRDIVSTIQREQDEAIRAPAHGVTLITGGPGTGKTQVALHRAAYMLYTDRFKFSDGCVLVVGPSTVFTEYIGRVLPGLGEDSVHLRAIGELFDGVTATRRDPANVAKVKGDLKTVRVLTDLAWDTPPNASDRLRTLQADDLTKARLEIRHRCEANGIKPNDARGIAATVLSEMLDGKEVPDGFLNSWWPTLTPRDVLPAQNGEWSVDDVPLLDELAEILGKPEIAAKKVPEWQLRELKSGLRLAETFVLSWSLNDGWQLFAPGLSTPVALSGQSIDNNDYWGAQRWASAIILREGHKVVSWIDGFDPYSEEGYLPVLAEPVPVVETEEHVEDVYLHIILDEAQDLSPMECRMIARRAAHASMTIVGRRVLAGVDAAAGQARGQDARPAHRLSGAAGHRRLRRPRRGAGHRAHPLVSTRRHPRDSPRGRPGGGRT